MSTKHAAQRDERTLMKHHATGLGWSKSERPQPNAQQGPQGVPHRAQLPTQALMPAQAEQTKIRWDGIRQQREPQMPRTYAEAKKMREE
jgi:hypothetical protein